MALYNRGRAGRVRACKLNYLGAAAASIVAIATLTPQAAYAQETDDSAAASDDNTIVVTGYRNALANSINTKRKSQSIVESVSAEDIGKLPDVSIAESIARLPGLAAQRVGGRAQIVSVRGLAPDFTTVLLNGRQQASSGYNRGVEFDQYPAELLSEVVVYKTPDANISGMGLAGTVDLRTVRPLSFGKRSFAVNIRGEYDPDGGRNPEVSKFGGRGSFSYIDQNKSGTLGWSIGYAYLDAPSHVDHYKAYGYESFGGVCQPSVGNPCSPNSVTPDSADNALELNGQEVFASNTHDQRHGVIGSLEWQPSDSVHTVLDLYYSRFKQRQVTRGAQWFSNAWTDNAAFSNVKTTSLDGSDLVTSGHFSNAIPILRNDNNQRDDELFAAGFNADFKLDDKTRFLADLSYSSNKRDETYIETYSGYGAGAFQTRTPDAYDFSIPLEGFPTYSGFGLNYADASKVSLGDRAPWGGWGHDGLIKSPHVKETVSSVEFGLERDLGGFFSKLDVGINFTHRQKHKTVDEIDLNLKNNRAQVLLDPKYVLSPTSLGFAGFGNVLSVDVLNAVPVYYDQSVLQDSNHFDKSWRLREDLITFRARLGIDYGHLTGNIGIQVLQQDQSSDGVAINQTVTPIAVTPNHDGASYTDFLPSLNLIYDLGGGHRLRFAASKVLARPRVDDLRANLTPSYSNPCAGGGSSSQDCQPGGTVHPWTATGGNPKLEPWRAKEIDLAYEWYIGRASYLSLGGFYKWLDSYIYSQQVTADFSSFPIPPTATPLPNGVTGSPIGVITSPQNGKGGYVRGIELSGALEFGQITRTLDGFGFTGSVAYTDSDLNPTADNTSVRIPGLSDWVYNLTGYYEKNGIQLRASYRFRSAFKGETVQLFTNLGFTEILADKQLDGQVGYTFPDSSPLKGLGVQLQLNNLLDSPYRTRLGLDAGGTKTSGGTPLPEIYEKYGRQFLLGVSYHF